MRFRKLLAAILVVATVSTTASAVVMQHELTPDYVKQNPGEFSVTAEMGNDGLVHFAVTRKVAKPCWIQAHLLVRKGETRIVEMRFPAVVREDSIRYYFAIPPEYLDDSTLELAERGIGYAVNAADERHPLPGTGGTDNVFSLKLFAPKAPAKGPPAAIAIKASEVLENFKRYDAIYESGFSASGTEEGKDLIFMEPRGNTFLRVKHRWTLTYGDDRFGYTAEVIDHEKLKYQPTNSRPAGQAGGEDQDEDSVKPRLTSIRTRTWGYWGQDLSGHYFEDTVYEVTPEDKATERGRGLKTSVAHPTDTSMSSSKYGLLWAFGRTYSRLLDKVTRVEESKDGLLVVSALGRDDDGRLGSRYTKGRWELEIEPAAAWMVRKARFYSNARPDRLETEMANSGTVWSGPYCIPKEAVINCFGSISGVETHRLTFDPLVRKFDEKLYSTVRQAVGYNKAPELEVHDYRVSPPTVTQPNRPKP